MRVRFLIWSIGSCLAAIITACTLAGSMLNAQAGQPAAAPAPAAPANIRNLTLVSTAFRTSAGPVTVSCTPSLCENLGVIVTPSVVHIVCPQLAGATCAYYIHVETQASVSANDSGIFQFLVDGVAPTPGPTDFHGFFAWDTADPNSTVMQARSYAVVALVTNSQANQSHSVEVEFGCVDETGDGCSSTMGLASMSIALYRP
ncbi:MAG: hypothetical protein JWQ87_4369 [Candidatus Sulfotelmatobacter sp.]|nr:hypothetical protein [Candidatus Sulfotelmatobacter sp.]